MLMKNNDSKFDVLYIDNNRIFRLFTFYMIIFYILFYIFSNNIKFSYYIVEISNIILNFGLMLITVSTSKYSKNKFFAFSAFCFLFMGLVNVFNFTLYTDNTMNNSFLGYENARYIEIQNILGSMYFFLALGTLSRDKRRSCIIRYLIMFILTIILLYIELSSSKLYFKTISIFIDIFSMFIFLCSLIKILKTFRMRFKNNGQINYFIIAIFILAVSTIFHVFSFIEGRPLIMFFYETLRLMGYVTIYYSLTENLLKKPYSLIFNDIYERNIKLKEINEEISYKNENMEKIRKDLKEGEVIFRNLLNSMPLPMFMVNNKNNRIIFVNKESAKMLNITSVKEVINKNIYNIIFFDRDSEPSASNWKSCDGYLKFRNKSIEVEITRYILNSEEDIAIFIVKDITERKKLDKLKSDFEKKQVEYKLQSNFLSTITHDLKTPINVIYSASQLSAFLAKENDIASLKKYNMINKDNCMTLIRLTNNLIDNSKITNDFLKPELELQNIVEIVEDATLQLIDYAKMKNLELVFDTQDEEIFVFCDRNFVERIVLNLLSNSIRYSQGGTINVEIKFDENYVYLEVRDFGKGISDDIIHKIFEKFNGTNIGGNIPNKSTGLGLYVVKNLVELQGGKIQIESELDVGTKVKIIFQREIDNV